MFGLVEDNIRVCSANDDRPRRSVPGGCDECNARDAKRAEVLSRNQNETWSLRSNADALPAGGKEERGDRRGRDAHASRLHRGIK